jgi:hypothetical protein
MGPSGVGSGGGQFVFGPETLDEGDGSVGFRLTYARPDQRSDEELKVLAGQHIHAHNTEYNLNASVGVAYGITHELTLSAELPFVRRDHLREGEHSHVGGQAINEVATLGNISGLGDMNILAKYRLTHRDEGGLALIAGIKVPTGSTHKHSADGERLETEHQPGTGSWDPIFGASAGTSVGPLKLSASALYQLSGKGAQHTELGDRLQAGIALSHHFGAAEHHHETSENHHHGDQLDEHHEDQAHATWDAFVELSGEWEGRQKVDDEIELDSGGKAVWLTPGARFNTAGGLSLGASIGVPVWQRIRASHPNNDYRVALSLGAPF